MAEELRFVEEMAEKCGQNGAGSKSTLKACRRAVTRIQTEDSLSPNIDLLSVGPDDRATRYVRHPQQRVRKPGGHVALFVSLGSVLIEGKWHAKQIRFRCSPLFLHRDVIKDRLLPPSWIRRNGPALQGDAII